MQLRHARRDHQHVNARAVVLHTQRQGVFGCAALDLCGKRKPIHGAVNADVVQTRVAFDVIGVSLFIGQAGPHAGRAGFTLKLIHVYWRVAVLAVSRQRHDNVVLAGVHGVAGQLAAQGGCPLPRFAPHERRQSDKELRIVVRNVFRSETLAVVFGNETRVEITRDKFRMRQQRRLKGDVAADAADHKTIQGFTHFGDGVQPVLAVHDELGDHRVVKHGNLAAVLHAGVDTHAVPVRSG